MKLVLRVVRRVLLSLAIVWGVVSVSWLLTVLLPGDAVRASLGPNASEEDVARARALYGTDAPIADRYVRFATRLVHGATAQGAHKSCAELGGGVHLDLGQSFTYRKPVVELVKKRLPASLQLAGAALSLQLVLGLTLGLLAAARRGSRSDEALTAVFATLGAAPTFVIGLLLQYLLAHRLGVVPLDGAGLSEGRRTPALILPALTLGLYGAAVFARLVRSEVGQAARELFVRQARARGASPRRALWVHALRASLSPVAQLAVLDFGALVGGAIVTEKLFRWPGLGELAVVSIQSRDPQALLGVTLIASVAMVGATLLADLLALALDPRLRAHDE